LGDRPVTAQPTREQLTDAAIEYLNLLIADNPDVGPTRAKLLILHRRITAGDTFAFDEIAEATGRSLERTAWEFAAVLHDMTGTICFPSGRVQ
jgi:hypothetical protein